MGKTKIAGSSGRFGVRYGQSARRRTSEIESKQRKKQACIFCPGRAVRLSKGIWQCKKCGKKFAGHAYYLEPKSNEKVAFQPSSPAEQASEKLKKSQKKSKNQEKSEAK